MPLSYLSKGQTEHKILSDIDKSINQLQILNFGLIKVNEALSSPDPAEEFLKYADNLIELNSFFYNF